MKVEKLFEQVSDFFGSKKKEQKNKSRQLEKIIDQLRKNKEKLKKEYRKQSDKKKKKEISKEYKAVVEMLRKAKKRYAKLS